MPKEKIIFVAVIYNNYEVTEQFCISLVTQVAENDESVQCFLIDNSDDAFIVEAVKRLECQFAFVKVLRPSNNLGYFGAFNYFFDHQKLAPDVKVVLCNNDLKFEENFCRRLRTTSYPEKVFVVCPDVVTADGVHQNPHHLSAISRTQKLAFDLYYSHYYVALLLLRIKGAYSRIFRTSHPSVWVKKPCEINQGVGAVYILLPTFFKVIDRLYFPWFLYGEEACLSWQVRSHGGSLWYDPNLKVWHAESATLSKLPRRKTYEYGRHSYWGLRKLI